MELLLSAEPPRPPVPVHKSALRSHGRSTKSDVTEDSNRPLVYTLTLSRKNQRMQEWKLRMERVFAGQAY